MNYIRSQQSGLAIGAMTRQSQVERDPLTAQHAPLIAETMPFVAHPQIRNRGTIGGCIAHADPAAELPAVAVALDASFRLLSANGTRLVRASKFFLGLFSTVLEPTELLTEMIVPSMPARCGYAFQEMSRRHGDYALAGVACTLTLDEAGVCIDARIVYLGLGLQPIDARNAAQHLIGVTPTTDGIQAVALAAMAEIDPSSDIHASADFRRQLAVALTRRALETAADRARVSLRIN
jgi:aerobic carbon-monoxide dehydrogenase medium subunit